MVTLTESDLLELDKLIQELPFKYAIGIVSFFNKKVQISQEVRND